MLVEKTIGIEMCGKIIPNIQFTNYGIVDIDKALRDFFSNYGYIFIAPYNLDEDLVIVQNKNIEIEGLICNYNIYDVINYRTGEVEISMIDTKTVSNYKESTPEYIFNMEYQIIFRDGKYRLIETKNMKAIEIADYMQFISSDIVVYSKHGLFYIFNLSTNEKFPLIKTDKHVYFGQESENFIDFRNSMFLKKRRSINNMFLSACDIDAFYIHMV